MTLRRVIPHHAVKLKNFLAAVGVEPGVEEPASYISPFSMKPNSYEMNKNVYATA